MVTTNRTMLLVVAPCGLVKIEWYLVYFCKRRDLVTFQDLTVSTMNKSVFWDIISCSLVEVYRPREAMIRTA